MKILLLNPQNPPPKDLKSTSPGCIVKGNRSFYPPLGLLYLASSIQKNTSYSVKILDCLINQLAYEEIKSEILAYNPDVVGMTIVTFNLFGCFTVANIVKECEKVLNKRIYVVAGGPHTITFPNETAKLGPIDFVLTGEGEFTFLSLLDNLENHDVLKTIPGIYYLKNGELVKGPPPLWIEDLDSISMPDRRLLDYKKYSDTRAGGDVMTTILSSRGCPYKCVFCNRLANHGNKIRNASAEYVIKEIEDCMSLGINEFYFIDDLFTNNKKRLIDICDYIKNKNLKIKFDIISRVNTIDEDMIRSLKDAGCRSIGFGVESGVQRILNRIKKGITLEQAEKAFKTAKKHKMDTVAFFMIGHPGETADDIRQTIKFAKILNPNYAWFYITIPNPNTELYKEGLERGIIEKDVWIKYAEKPYLNITQPRWVENISESELVELLNQCYRGFYLRPSYVFRQIISVQNFKALKKKLYTGIKLILQQAAK